MSSSRREFIAAGAAFTAAAARALGANDRAGVVVVGVGGRGTDHLKNYMTIPEARIVAVCDVNQTAREVAAALVQKQTGDKVKEYEDMRKAFEDKDVDAVSIATPNHWHALATIWACQAGKDVYVEKPACYNVHEGERMVEVARHTGRIVQVGMQSRSLPHKIQAMKLLHEGVIGNVYMAKGLCFKRRKSIGHAADGPVPAGLNWDMFLGPAPMRPYNPLRYKYNWHWFWDTGNGDIGNQGVHEMDVARWGMGDVEWPKAVVADGGKYAYTDDQETPNTQLAIFDYGGREIVFEVRGLLTGGEGGLERRGGNFVGDLFYGSDGWMAVDGAGFQVYKGEKSELAMDVKKEPGPDTSPHMQNFLAACRSRNYKDLHADVAVGVQSAGLCHLANASYRSGRKLTVDSTGHFVKDEEANKLLTRPKYRAPYVV